MTDSDSGPAQPQPSAATRPHRPEDDSRRPPAPAGMPTVGAGLEPLSGESQSPVAAAASVPRTWGSEILAATVITVVMAALGALTGPLWQWLTPGVEVVMTSDGPIHANPRAETYFADDGTFALIGLVMGVAAAFASWWLARRHRGPVLLAALVAGCLLGAVVAWQVGGQIGLAGFRSLVHSAEPGQSFRRPATLSAFGVLGVQAFAAAFTHTLLAGWCGYPDLRGAPGRW